MMNGAVGPLDGVRVLDFTQMLSGPCMTQYMAEMGAEVIKVEFPGGDYSRGMPFVRDGRSGYFIQQNRGKKSICLDLKDTRAIEIVLDLVPTVDVLAENFTPGAMDRLGLGYELLAELHPGLIMCSISAFGQDGELSRIPGYDNIAQAYSGVTWMNGDPDGPPALLGAAVGDVLAGVNAVAAVVAALFQRERGGPGQRVDIAMLDTYMQTHEINVQAVSGSRGSLHPKRSGSHHSIVCPYGVFRAPDHDIFIAVPSQHQWPAVCEAIGQPKLADDPRFASHSARLEHLDELVKIVEGWLGGFGTSAEAIARLQKFRVPVAPVLTVQEAMNHPHARARGTVRTVIDPVWGEVDLPGFPLRFSASSPRTDLTAAYLGEHNREVLVDQLGYSEEKVRELAAAGVVLEEPLTAA